MGLISTNYTITASGITISEAYAKVTDLYIDTAGNAKAVLSIQQSREACETLLPLEQHEVNFIADKTQPIFTQAYNAAKIGLFNGWVDDIPEAE